VRGQEQSILKEDLKGILEGHHTCHKSIEEASFVRTVFLHKDKHRNRVDHLKGKALILNMKKLESEKNNQVELSFRVQY
jgi:hypothetical protein